jgi:hypothetical protein
MQTGEKQLSSTLKLLLWFVVLNTVAGALILILFPTQTERLFFWSITPPINARLMGVLYLVGGAAVTYAALRGSWEALRVVAVMAFAISALFVIVTLVHRDRFVPGVKLYYWLSVYSIVPILMALLFRRYEGSGADWQATQNEIKSVTRLVALLTGLGILFVAIVGLLFPNLLITVWPWQVAPLMLRVLMSWLFALGLASLWIWLEKEWTRVQVVAYALIATPIVVAVTMSLHGGDLSDNPLILGIFGLLFILLGLIGAFMIWQQRR